MKVGIRKPNIKRSIKARTTGKVKRAVKKSVNPLYGKKGMGYIKDPKKAVYNKVYNKTTVSVSDISGINKNTSRKTNNVTTNNINATYTTPTEKKKGNIGRKVLIVFAVLCLIFGNTPLGIILLIIWIALLISTKKQGQE